ncbi:DNA cytosine methyltransferase [Nitrosovibrio sp. Nv6]|uniref:DNA cytosine methyltransferase n=1 Tax=Nitrosovibrio sp. Nv6 TaxID=1855340 RepID=UPI0008B70D9E|nr:DNA (cytosine-5-)-methyltransferase [Nitrosovibrio sp. Nv6]SEP19453.1 DNA (cytosine-5)-methyltransferase 1 [Nitrosovibrio sp. Nv6]
MSSKYAVVDIFAGPGGLAEGFSSVLDSTGDRPFSIALSIEKETTAYSTLLLRSFLRLFGGNLPDNYYRFLNEGTAEPDWAELYPKEWAKVKEEAWQLELGVEDSADRLDARLDKIRDTNAGNVVLIGGPPCQAYSLVGRARNQGKEGYSPKEDRRHFLYEEYIRILRRLRPAAFVMENVKGMLSSSVDGKSRIFDGVLEDLRGDHRDSERYRLLALAPRLGRQLDVGRLEPKAVDFVIRSEDFGIPQARHRVIVVGIRGDLAQRIPDSSLGAWLDHRRSSVTIGSVLDGMPRLRSGLSKSADGDSEWRNVVLRAMAKVAEIDSGLPADQHLAFATRAAKYRACLAATNELPGREGKGVGIAAKCPAELRDWLIDTRLTTLPNHQARCHMESDLARYFYAAVYAEASGRSPKASDFPPDLAPAHQNWTSGKFADRFRVQLAGAPSTTVTSHISKDGHYFIHPDPLQCRSLSVREAARLQTFPDNYFFKGNRTQQYIQVGNAVPPLLARWIGEALSAILIETEHVGAGLSPEQNDNRKRLSHVA